MINGGKSWCFLESNKEQQQWW